MSSISSECILTSRGTRSFLEPLLMLQNVSPEILLLVNWPRKYVNHGKAHFTFFEGTLVDANVR